MEYKIAAIETVYKRVKFRSRLEARWAAFFDLAGLNWKYEPIDLEGWIPDFWLAIPCRHSECIFTTDKCDEKECSCHGVLLWKIGTYEMFGKTHSHEYPIWSKKHYRKNFTHDLYVEVKPFYSIKEFDGHPVSKIPLFDVPSPAMFGIDPSVTEWSMAHGAGGGIETIEGWVDDCGEKWAEAGNIVRYEHRRKF